MSKKIKSNCKYQIKWYNSIQVGLFFRLYPAGFYILTYFPKLDARCVGTARGGVTFIHRGDRYIMLDTKILVVDDDLNISELLRLFMENEGYAVRIANDGAEGVSAFKLFEPDLVLLDVMLPKKDGWQVLREIREMSSKPVIMITAKGEVFDRVLGLELGADDFVVKPFDMKELAARAKAVLRRANAHNNPDDSEVIKYDSIEISKQKYELKLKGKPVDIPPKELELLYFLASNYNRVFTRDQLLDKVWGFDYLGDSRTVDVHVKRLREKLENVSEKWALKTVWGVGYKFELIG